MRPGKMTETGCQKPGVSVVSVTAMFAAAPPVLMTAAPAPAIMMSAPATVHLAVAASTTALDLNDGIVIRDRGAGGGDSQPRGSWHRHRQRRYGYRGRNQ